MNAVTELPEEERPQEHQYRDDRIEILAIRKVTEETEGVEGVERCEGNCDKEQRVHNVAERLVVVLELSRRDHV